MSNRKIFLKNIFLKTKSVILEKTSEPLLLTSLLQSYEHIDFDEYIEKIDSSYYSLEDWKKNTNLACWNCGLKFTGIPWFIPLSWTFRVESGEDVKYKIIHNFPDGIHKQEKKMVKPYGNFCHPRCAVRFLKETMEIAESQKSIYMSLICLLFFEFTGNRVNHIEPAPPKQKMMKYCGENGWSKEKYKSMLGPY